MILQDIRHMMPQQDPNKQKPYEFQPYPKMMTYEQGGKKVPYKHPNGSEVIVVNEAEEKEFLAKAEPPEEKPAAPVEPRAENKIIAKKTK